MRSSVLFLCSVFLGIVGGHAGADESKPDQSATKNIAAATVFQAGAGVHLTLTEAALSGTNQIDVQKPGAIPAENWSAVAPALTPRTRTSFMASWDKVSEAGGYRLDVSTSRSFKSCVIGYENLDVGNVTGRAVTGLSPGTTYYYRVRAYNAAGTSGHSNTTTATTAPATGLIIDTTFDSSILSDPNSLAIQAMINQAVARYESLFADPITVHILFRYSTTAPNGNPLGSGLLARSDWVFYTFSWNTGIGALQADAKTSNDATANASLPGAALSTNLKPASANGRAIGLNTPPAMFANGTVGAGGPYDGIVTLNSAQPFQFTRPPGSNYDAMRSTEHEIDEVMGLGSYLNIGGSDLRPQDLFSWSSAGTRNLTSSGTRYFSINSGTTNIVNFNQIGSGDFGDWLSGSCPQTNPYVQNAFSCPSQFSDVTASSPEGIDLDVIGYDLVAQVLSAVSRKTHGGAGNFDVDLPLSGTPGIECRAGGATNDYTMLATFSANISVNGSPQAQVISGTATVGSGGVGNGGMVTVSGNTVTVPLTNVGNAQTINVRLNAVNGSTTVNIPMSLLAGDTNANAAVNSADVAQTKSRIGQTLNAANFRSDVNANGAINSADVSTIKSNIGLGLP